MWCMQEGVWKWKSIKSESVPCYGDGAYHTNARVDMCEECAKKIRKVIYDNFAEIRDCYGLSVKKKFWVATVRNGGKVLWAREY